MRRPVALASPGPVGLSERRSSAWWRQVGGPDSRPTLCRDIELTSGGWS